MATQQLNGALMRADDPASLSPADRAAHELASFTRRRILAEVPAGNPRGSWPAEEFAAEQRAAGVPAEVVMDLAADMFLVIVRTAQLVAS